MKPITFECPHCHEVIPADESPYGQPVRHRNCQPTTRISPTAASPEEQGPRPIQEPAAADAPAVDRANRETDVFRLSPVARAFSGQILLGLVFVASAVGVAIRGRDLSWSPWVAAVPLALGVLLLLLVWIRVRSCSYRLTTQRLFVRRGWLARQVSELELYRVKDVVVEQGLMPRLLGYGTITVLADDQTTPQVDLAGISGPIRIKEMIRTQYRAARQREGVRPTEFMQS